jgi:hypothetical protein
MTKLPVINGENSTNVEDDFGFLLNYEMDLQTSK